MKTLFFKLSAIILILLLSGCAGDTKKLVFWNNEEITFPNGTVVGGASTEQATALAEIFVNAHNQTMTKLDAMQQQQQQQMETADKALRLIENLSKQQGTGEITLFFNTGSYRLNNAENQRLVRFLDFISRESHGRKVLLISIGSASAFGNQSHNEKLATRRSQAPVDSIEKYLINIPYEFYKVYSIGDRYSPSDISVKKQKNYQHTRLIAVFETDQIPALPE